MVFKGLTDEVVIKFSAGVVGDGLNFADNGLSIVVDNGIITSIEGGNVTPDINLSGYLVMPPVANMHVHVLDYVVPEAGLKLSIDEVVGEPHGIKYKIIEKASKTELLRVIREFKSISWRLGTGFIAEFRELGTYGLSIDKRERTYGHFVLGMPSTHNPQDVRKELPELLKQGDGLGISSPLYFSEDLLSYAISEFKKASKPVFSHISETKETWEAGDLDLILRVGPPDTVIHGTWLRYEELQTLLSYNVNLVLCIRSNEWFRVGLPDIKAVYESGINVSLGTDNCGWIKPDPWREAERLFTLARTKGVNDAKWVLKALLNASPVGVRNSIIEGGPANFIVLRYSGTVLERAKDKYAGLVKRGGEDLVVSLVMNGACRYCVREASSLRHGLRNNVS